VQLCYTDLEHHDASTESNIDDTDNDENFFATKKQKIDDGKKAATRASGNDCGRPMGATFTTPSASVFELERRRVHDALSHAFDKPVSAAHSVIRDAAASQASDSASMSIQQLLIKQNSLIGKLKSKKLQLIKNVTAYIDCRRTGQAG
jgi:hypothetical protein